MSVIAKAGLVLALCAALAGCGSSASAGPEPKPAAKGAAIDFAKGGGLAATLERLHIAPGGQTVMRLGYPGDVTTSRFKVPARRLASIRAGLAAADFANIGKGSPTGCADCFTYQITYRGHTVDRVEIDVPEKLGPVIGQLLGIIDAHSG